MEELKAFTIQLPLSQWQYVQRTYGRRGMSHFFQDCVDKDQRASLGHQNMMSMLQSISSAQDTIMNLLREGGK